MPLFSHISTRASICRDMSYALNPMQSGLTPES